MTALTELSLRDNALTGSIPTELGLMTALKYLGLSDTTLTGPIPTELGLMTALTTLELPESTINGTISNHNSSAAWIVAAFGQTYNSSTTTSI